MITDLNKIIAEWSFRTKSGILDAKSMPHQIILEELLKEYGWPLEARSELVNNLMEQTEDDDNKIIKWKDEKGEDREATLKTVKGYQYDDDYEKSKYKQLGVQAAGLKDRDVKDKDVKVDKPGDITKDPDNFKRDFDKKTKKKELTPVEKEMKGAPEIDVNKTTDTEVGSKVKPFVEKISKRITQLVKEGKMEEAKALAQNIIDKYHITKPLYLQPDKKGLGKIKIGTKYKNFMGGKNSPSQYQQKIIDAIQSSGAVIPMRKKGISATSLAPNQVHANFDKNGKPQFKKGNVKTIKNKKGQIIAKEIRIADRKFVLKVDPNEPISLLKLKTLPEGDVDFIDINSADTPEGRTECIVNATDNLIDTFSKIEDNITDDFNKGISKKLKQLTKELQELEKKKNAAESEEEIKSLQNEFYKKGLEILETTKIANPTSGGVNEFNGMASYISETIEAVGYLNRGIETYIPASGNFETNDVLPFIKNEPKPVVVSNDGFTADEMNMYLKNEDHLTPAGASVKFAGGGASQLLSRIDKSTFKDKNVKMKINGQERKGTKEILNGLTNTYSKLFPDTSKPPKPLTNKEYNDTMKQSKDVLYEYYPELKNNKEFEKDLMDSIEKSVRSQLDRLNKDRTAKGEGYENAVKRMIAYHYSQFVAVAVHNHPERGLKKQAFGNSDYASSKKGGVVKIERIHTDGENTLSYAGWDRDMGYTVSKIGKITPTNVYSSRLKHKNVTDNYIKKFL